MPFHSEGLGILEFMRTTIHTKPYFLAALIAAGIGVAILVLITTQSNGPAAPGSGLAPATDLRDPREIRGATWRWDSTRTGETATIIPDRPEAFTLTFGADGRVIGRTDCNGFSGTYTVAGDQLTFGPFAMTKMYCEGSQETDFVTALEGTSNILLQSGADGNQTLVLTNAAGVTRLVQQQFPTRTSRN